MMITTDSPRLAVTPGEWYASGMLTLLSRDLRQMNGAMYNSRIEWDFLHVDSAAADSGVVELDDLIPPQLSFPPEEFASGWDTAAAACGAVKLDDIIFHHTSFPPDVLSAGRDGDYIWLNSGTGLSVCARPVTGSLCFGHPH